VEEHSSVKKEKKERHFFFSIPPNCSGKVRNKKTWHRFHHAAVTKFVDELALGGGCALQLARLDNDLRPVRAILHLKLSSAQNISTVRAISIHNISTVRAISVRNISIVREIFNAKRQYK
jgi:hypothetical protein